MFMIWDSRLSFEHCVKIPATVIFIPIIESPFTHATIKLISHCMCKIVIWLDLYYLSKSNTYILQDLDYELINWLWNGFLGTVH